MKKKIEEEINRILSRMKETDDTVKLREYSLTVESLVMSLSRI